MRAASAGGGARRGRAWRAGGGRPSSAPLGASPPVRARARASRKPPRGTWWGPPAAAGTAPPAARGSPSRRARRARSPSSRHATWVSSRPCLAEELARDHDPLDLRGALVDLGDLGVPEVALHGELARVAVATVHLHRLRGERHRGLGGEELRDRRLLRIWQTAVLQESRPQRQE